MKKMFLVGFVFIFLLQFQSISAFYDLDSSHKNKLAITTLNDLEIISGYPDGSFKPENTINRAELLKILVGGKGLQPKLKNYNNCIPDVKEEWFAPYVCYAKESEWVSGYPDGTFQPARTVSKVEAIKMVVNANEYNLKDASNEELFNDTDQTSWYAPYLKVAKKKKLIEEDGDIFEPSGNMTRGAVSENIFRTISVNALNRITYSKGLNDRISEIKNEFRGIKTITRKDLIDQAKKKQQELEERIRTQDQENSTEDLKISDHGIIIKLKSCYDDPEKTTYYVESMSDFHFQKCSFEIIFTKNNSDAFVDIGTVSAAYNLNSISRPSTLSVRFEGIDEKSYLLMSEVGSENFSVWFEVPLRVHFKNKNIAQPDFLFAVQKAGKIIDYLKVK